MNLRTVLAVFAFCRSWSNPINSKWRPDGWLSGISMALMAMVALCSWPAQAFGFQKTLPPPPLQNVTDQDDPAMPSANDPASEQTAQGFDSEMTKLVDEVTSPEQLPSTLKALLTLGVLSLAPAILLMTTCYVRVVVVLSLLRQAFGAQNLPPNQVVTALALFITLLVMAPVWNDVKTNAIDPYVAKEMTWDESWEAGVTPVKRFMSRQIEMAHHSNDILTFYRYLPEEEKTQAPETYQDVPIKVMLPAFVVSELKIAFMIGFQIFLPFLVIDLIVSSGTISMGMYMLPPTMVSLPLKIILFVIVDGWNLVIGMLLQSFAPYT